MYRCTTRWLSSSPSARNSSSVWPYPRNANGSRAARIAGKLDGDVAAGGANLLVAPQLLRDHFAIGDLQVHHLALVLRRSLLVLLDGLLHQHVAQGIGRRHHRRAEGRPGRDDHRG